MSELPQNNSERIEDPKLAEEMAYVENPSREVSLDIKKSRQEEYLYEKECFDEEIEELREMHRRGEINDNELEERIKKATDDFEEEWNPNSSEGFHGRNYEDDIKRQISLGIRHAEDYQRTYLRRAKKGPLSEKEALGEGSLVQERAREEAEDRLLYSEMMTPLGPREEWGMEELKEYNDIRNWLAKPLDEHISSANYDEALEYIERLKEVPSSDFVTWLTARLQLKALGIKAWLRNKKREAKET